MESPLNQLKRKSQAIKIKDLEGSNTDHPNDVFGGDGGLNSSDDERNLLTQPIVCWPFRSSPVCCVGWVRNWPVATYCDAAQLGRYRGRSGTSRDLHQSVPSNSAGRR